MRATTPTLLAIAATLAHGQSDQFIEEGAIDSLLSATDGPAITSAIISVYESLYTEAAANPTAFLSEAAAYWDRNQAQVSAVVESLGDAVETAAPSLASGIEEQIGWYETQLSSLKPVIESGLARASEALEEMPEGALETASPVTMVTESAFTGYPVAGNSTMRVNGTGSMTMTSSVSVTSGGSGAEETGGEGEPLTQSEGSGAMATAVPVVMAGLGAALMGLV